MPRKTKKKDKEPEKVFPKKSEENIKSTLKDVGFTPKMANRIIRRIKEIGEFEGKKEPIIDQLMDPTSAVRMRLEIAFAIGCSNAEAANYAGIYVQSIYELEKRDPTFSDRKYVLKHNLSMRAKMNIYKAIEDEESIFYSSWLLGRMKAYEDERSPYEQQPPEKTKVMSSEDLDKFSTMVNNLSQNQANEHLESVKKYSKGNTDRTS